MTRVLVTGARGLLGATTVAALAGRGVDALALGHAELDIADANAVSGAVGQFAPDAIVNCAAMTDVDACEREPERAHAANAQGPANLAAHGVYLVHVSTDYVFDGTKGAPYVESDRPNPIQRHGASKLAGEDAVRSSGCEHAIVRSAWIYGRGGKNFLSRLFDYAAAGPLRVVADQRGSPTYATDLAGAIAELIESRTTGTLHLVNDGSCSWAEFVRFALGSAGVEADVREISGADLNRAAPRPASTVLTSERVAPLRPWRAAAGDFVRCVSA